MTPGSIAAKMYGCICSEAENNFGIGCTPILDINQKFTVAVCCPIHGAPRWTIPHVEQNNAGLVTAMVYGKMSK